MSEAAPSSSNAASLSHISVELTPTPSTQRQAREQQRQQQQEEREDGHVRGNAVTRSVSLGVGSASRLHDSQRRHPPVDADHLQPEAIERRPSLSASVSLSTDIQRHLKRHHSRHHAAHQQQSTASTIAGDAAAANAAVDSTAPLAATAADPAAPISSEHHHHHHPHEHEHHHHHHYTSHPPDSLLATATPEHLVYLNSSLLQELQYYDVLTRELSTELELSLDHITKLQTELRSTHIALEEQTIGAQIAKQEQRRLLGLREQHEKERWSKEEQLKKQLHQLKQALRNAGANPRLILNGTNVASVNTLSSTAPSTITSSVEETRVTINDNTFVQPTAPIKKAGVVRKKKGRRLNSARSSGPATLMAEGSSTEEDDDASSESETGSDTSAQSEDVRPGIPQLKLVQSIDGISSPPLSPAKPPKSDDEAPHSPSGNTSPSHPLLHLGLLESNASTVAAVDYLALHEAHQQTLTRCRKLEAKLLEQHENWVTYLNLVQSKLAFKPQQLHQETQTNMILNTPSSAVMSAFAAEKLVYVTNNIWKAVEKSLHENEKKKKLRSTQSSAAASRDRSLSPVAFPTSALDAPSSTSASTDHIIVPFKPKLPAEHAATIHTIQQRLEAELSNVVNADNNAARATSTAATTSSPLPPAPTMPVLSPFSPVSSYPDLSSATVASSLSPTSHFTSIATNPSANAASASTAALPATKQTGVEGATSSPAIPLARNTAASSSSAPANTPDVLLQQQPAQIVAPVPITASPTAATKSSTTTVRSPLGFLTRIHPVGSRDSPTSSFLARHRPIAPAASSTNTNGVNMNGSSNTSSFHGVNGATRNSARSPSGNKYFDVASLSEASARRKAAAAAAAASSASSSFAK